MGVTDVVKNVPFSPAITGALLYALTKAPEKYRSTILAKLHVYLSPQNIRRTVTTLKWLFALGLARNLHVWLSDIAQNNFHVRSQRHRYQWNKEVAVVTGAASGFGALFAQGLAANGINVAAVDIRDDLPDELKDHPKIKYYKCDITNREKVMELAETIQKTQGDVSILLNNAGVCYQHNIVDASEKTLRSLYDVNIIAHYFTLQAFLPTMIKNKKGHVLATASMGSFIAPPGLVPYCNTKAAVLSLHEGIKQEMRVVHKCPEVKFSTVHPTYAATPMVKPFQSQLTATKAFVLNPQVVADAVVAQILSGKGRQIIITEPGTSFMASIRGFPHWLSAALLRLTDMEHTEKGVEKSGS